ELVIGVDEQHRARVVLSTSGAAVAQRFDVPLLFELPLHGLDEAAAVVRSEARQTGRLRGRCAVEVAEQLLVIRSGRTGDVDAVARGNSFARERLDDGNTLPIRDLLDRLRRSQ